MKSWTRIQIKNLIINQFNFEKDEVGEKISIKKHAKAKKITTKEMIKSNRKKNSRVKFKKKIKNDVKQNK